MATIHTIKINGDHRVKGVVSATRKTTGRRYLACIVATTTEESVRISAERKAETERELAAERKALAAAMAKHGMTPEQAEAWHKEQSDKWHGDAARAVSDAVYKQCSAAAIFGDRAHAMEDAAKVKAGFVDPYAKDSPWAICTAADNVSGLERTLAAWPVLTVGAQGVVSWHGREDLAHKELGSRTCTALAARGDKLEVRTDIETREVKPRAGK